MQQYKILLSEVGYQTAVDRTIEIFDAEPGTPDFDELKELLLLIKDYEDKHYLIPVPQPYPNS